MSVIAFYVCVSCLISPILSQNSSLFEAITKNPSFNPILSIQFKYQYNGMVCDAHGLLPVTYNVKVLNTEGIININSNYFARDDYSSRLDQHVFICEASIIIGNTTWKKIALWSYPVKETMPKDKYVDLVRSNAANKGIIRLTDSGNHFRMCLDDFMNNTQGRLNGYVVCHELGYNGISSLQLYNDTFKNLFNSAYIISNISCKGNELRLTECLSRYGRGSAHNCRSNSGLAGVVCLRSPQYANIHAFQSNPRVDIDVNDVINVTCSFEFIFGLDVIIEMWRIQGSKGKMYSVYDTNSTLNILRYTGRRITVSYTHIYKPNKIYKNDTFVCIVKDSSGTFSDKKELFVKYKFPFEKLVLEAIVNNNIVTPNVSGNGSDYFKLASHLKCSGTYDSNDSVFSWSYTRINGTNYAKGQVINLDSVERRLPICCHVKQTMKSRTYNLTKCITIDETPEVPVLKTVTFCDMKRLDVTCPASTDLVMSSFHLGYFSSCFPTDYQNCSHYVITNFVQEERCTSSSCRFTNFFNRSYFRLLLNALPRACLTGSKPLMTMTYYCL